MCSIIMDFNDPDAANILAERKYVKIIQGSKFKRL